MTHFYLSLMSQSPVWQAALKAAFPSLVVIPRYPGSAWDGTTIHTVAYKELKK